jgi:hypothetical protein
MYVRTEVAEGNRTWRHTLCSVVSMTLLAIVTHDLPFRIYVFCLCQFLRIPWKGIGVLVVLPP